MRICKSIWDAFFVCGFVMLPQVVLATDHNEPDLLNSFYADRNGSGSDIYGVVAYPNDSGETLNFGLTMAPVPKTGVFEPNSVQRVYFYATEEVQLQAEKVLEEFQKPTAESSTGFFSMLNPVTAGVSAARQINAFEKYMIWPTVQVASGILNDAVKTNNLPFDQTTFPEIRITYSRNGMNAKLEFLNFYFRSGAKESGQAIVKSSGVEKDPAKLAIVDYRDMKIFVGGRDDDFTADIGGFFRSINWRSALNENNDFIWEGKISYKDSGSVKESNDAPKHLIDLAKKQGVYNGYDWRLGNNINAIILTIPIRYVNPDEKKLRLLRIWAESFLTEQAYYKIAK